MLNFLIFKIIVPAHTAGHVLSPSNAPGLPPTASPMESACRRRGGQCGFFRGLQWPAHDGRAAAPGLPARQRPAGADAGPDGPGHCAQRTALGPADRPIGRPPRAADRPGQHRTGPARPGLVGRAGRTLVGAGRWLAGGGPAGGQRQWRQWPGRDGLVSGHRTRSGHEHPPDRRAPGRGVGALLLPWLAWQGGFACLFGVLAGLCGAAALLCAAWVHEPAHSAHSAPAPAPGAGLAAPAPRALRDRRVWRLAAGIGLLCAPQFAVISFGTVFLHDFGGLSLPACTGAMALVQVGAMGLRVWSGRWTDRHGNRPAYLRACVGAVIAVFLGLAALSALQSALPSAGGGWSPQGLQALLAAWLVLAGLVVSAWHGVAYAELATLAGARQSGTA